MKQTANTVCDVCVRVDGDRSTKPCNWCSLCQSWICHACWPNLVRRARAMAVKAREAMAG